ncbi:NAD(P)H-hydrate dehydratase [uncultured Enterovirga sp.]|uniref:NAD(P)H-hydrate dehydratase n=1 Tax=uncultured Enterovirga sp. TaxID=2026352 RepID=UPI0035CB2A81
MTKPITVDGALLRSMPLPEPGDGGGKEERGRVLVVGGSRELPGAVLLAGTAALRAGAGKLQIGAPASLGIPLGLAVPEAMAAGLAENESGSLAVEAAERIVELGNKCRAVLIGPGLDEDDDTERLTRAVLEGLDGPPIVLDAASMMRIASCREALARQAGRLLITPHTGEMAGILDIDKEEIEADPAATALRAARDLGIIVVLKGSCSFIATPDGQRWSCSHGNVGLATSGSGDTLAGFMTGLLGRGAEPVQAALWSVFLHGEAGNRLARSVGPLGYLARELLREIPGIMADLRHDGTGERP